jgi:peptide/nickel transport system permease protein
MKVAKLIAWRLGGLALTLLVASFAIFSLLYVAPGNPLTTLLGSRGASPERVAALKAQYHLDEPFLARYWHWVSDALHGDLGRSIVFNQPVAHLIAGRVATTVLLVGLSAVLIMLGGVAAGTLAAMRPGRVDGGVMAGATLGLATPAFVIGVALIGVFAVNLGWFPAFGGGAGVPDKLWHLTLPALTLACGGVAYTARITRAAVRTELGREHVETARSRGLPEPVIVRRHVLRNAMIPITTVAGLTIAALIAGTVVVENVFALDGLGSLLVRSILQKDFAIVQAVVLILVTAFVVINTAVDLLYTAIDPRLR